MPKNIQLRVSLIVYAARYLIFLMSQLMTAAAARLTYVVPSAPDLAAVSVSTPTSLARAADAA